MKNCVSIVAFWVSLFTFGQDQLTLQQCADKLMKNSLLISKEQRSLKEASVNRKLHYWDMIPTLNASIGLSTNFGRIVNPYTNTFTTNNVNNQDFGLTTEMVLFNGLNYFHNRRLLDQTIQQSQLGIEAKRNEQLIRLIELYAILCQQAIQIRQSEIRIEKYRAIQQLQLILLQGGRISSIDTLRSNNSLLNEQLLCNNLKSEQRFREIELNYLIGEPLESVHTYDPESITLMTILPLLKEELELKNLDMQREIIEQKQNIQRSEILPSLSLSGNITTGFSTYLKDTTKTGYPTLAYNNQLQQNLAESIGLYLKIPLFNRGSWLKKEQLTRIGLEALTDEISLKNLEKEKHIREIEQNKLKKQLEILQTGQIVQNLQLIYDKTFLLYQEGRSTYSDLELSFLEWQKKVTELETLKLEYQKMKLILF